MRQLLLRSSYGDTVLLQLIAANCDSAQFAALVQLLVKMIAHFKRVQWIILQLGLASAYCFGLPLLIKIEHNTYQC